jgi:hypothetical protein
MEFKVNAVLLMDVSIQLQFYNNVCIYTNLFFFKSAHLPLPDTGLRILLS